MECAAHIHTHLCDIGDIAMVTVLLMAAVTGSLAGNLILVSITLTPR